MQYNLFVNETSLSQYCLVLKIVYPGAIWESKPYTLVDLLRNIWHHKCFIDCGSDLWK